MDAKFFDNLETREASVRERAQFGLLPDLIRRAREVAPGWKEHLRDVGPDTVTSRAELARLPVLRKSLLRELQLKRPPFGGFATLEAGAIARIFMSPGPIFEPEGKAVDWWRSGRALYAAGFRSGDVVHNTFAYQLTPGGWIMDAGARSLGCTVIPAGPGNTEQQIEAIAQLQPSGYIGVPDFLKILLDQARETGRPISSFKRALVSGGALFPSLRKEYKSAGIATFQAYATADVGIIAYESAALDGLIVDEGVIVEVVRPGTGEPVPEGEVGEVIVTSFSREYPMIRLATGDLSAVLEGQSPCGRTNMRIKGWMGRADQATKVKGMFVRPEQLAEIGRLHRELGRLRLVVSRAGEQDVMTLMAEAEHQDMALAARVAETLAKVTKLRGDVQLSALGSLPNDGKVIVDERSYS